MERKLYECTRADGSRYYRLDFLDQRGRRVREPAGDTLTEARHLRTRRDYEVRQGTYEHPDDKAKREAAARLAAVTQRGPTFAEFADRFERDYASQRKSDYYELTLRPIRAFFGEMRLRDIRPADLDRYRAHSFDVDRRGASTVRKRLTILGTMFRQAVRWGVLDVNPAADLAKPGEPEHKTRYLSREEWQRLHDHAEPWLRPILTLAVLTGARLKEVVGITWENVDRASGVLFISEDNKTGKPRGVPMSAPVLAILDAMPGARFKKAGPVFVQVVDGAELPYTSRRQRNRISQRTRATAKAAGLPGVTFHTLRHTAGSWLAQAGYSEVQIAKLLGHVTTQTTRRYMHLSPAHLRGAADALAAVLERHEKDTSPASPVSTPVPDAAILPDLKTLGG